MTGSCWHFLKQHAEQKRTDINSKEVNSAKQIRLYHNHNNCAKCLVGGGGGGGDKVHYSLGENGEYWLTSSIAIAVKNFR